MLLWPRHGSDVGHLTRPPLKVDGPARELAWREFHRRYAPIIAGFARKLGMGGSDVVDLIQDVTTGFYAAQPRFIYDPRRGRFRGYLKTRVTNAIAERARKGKLKVGGGDVEFVPDGTAADAWEASWQRERLTRALARLRTYYDANATYAAFHRIAIEGAEVSAVAAEFGISVDSAHKARARCQARLKIVLDELDEEEE